MVQLKGVGKAFGDRVLLRDADLSVYASETLAIVGESGSGKSVLLKMVLGLMEADAGTILFKGQEVGDMDQAGLDQLRRQVGYVFQNDALFDSMTVLDNIGYAMREHTRATPEHIHERALECLQYVGLEPWRLEQFPSELSGGQRKRVGIARAVAIKPEIIFYDEPTQGLDPQSISRIALLIAGLQKQLRATSVIVTHDMRTAFTVADRVALLHDGRFDYHGTRREIAESDAEPVREFLGEALDELRELPFLSKAEALSESAASAES